MDVLSERVSFWAKLVFKTVETEARNCVLLRLCMESLMRVMSESTAARVLEREFGGRLSQKERGRGVIELV